MQNSSLQQEFCADKNVNKLYWFAFVVATFYIEFLFFDNLFTYFRYDYEFYDEYPF